MKLPYYLQVTDKVNFADSKLFRLRVNPKHVDDAGLIAHELTHVKQWYACMLPALSMCLVAWFMGYEQFGFYGSLASIFIKGLLYTFVPQARQLFEVQAYRKQIEVEGDQHIEEYAELLATDYGLNLSVDSARKYLSLGE